MGGITLALWVLVVALGIQTGAGLIETLVLVPLWSSAPPESVIAFNAQPMRPDSGRRFWIFSTPVVGLVSLANVFFAWRSAGPQRVWWLASAGSSVVIVIVAFAYFAPILLTLLRASELPANDVARMVRWWVRLNRVRAVVLVAAWLAALKAFSYGA